MASGNITVADRSIPARDGYALAATLFCGPVTGRGVIVINSATAVPRRFYRHFATALADAGYLAVTYDYRGIGDSRPSSLRGFDATMRDWAFKDMAGVLDWVLDELRPDRVMFVGHSFGGQAAGLLDRGAQVAGMATMSAQSGHWRLQGAEQKWLVGLHVHATLPLLARMLGYMPWSWVGAGEDLPKGVALEWAAWCRDRRYLLGDDTLPLERFRDFSGPVLAYSFDDDKWGTPAAVDAMMQAYPNLERRHVAPRQVGLRRIGHVGYFRPAAAALWEDTIRWFDALAPAGCRRSPGPEQQQD
jgi:predicted alpha/beta hydrolase